MTPADYRLLIAAVIGIALSIALIIRGRLHPFVGLLCGAFTVGLIAELRALGAAATHKVTLEIGTRSETHIIVIERAEHWVHLHGDPSRPDHAAHVWAHRVAMMPDDRAWESQALAHGAAVLADAVRALS